MLASDPTGQILWKSLQARSRRQRVGKVGRGTHAVPVGYLRLALSHTYAHYTAAVSLAYSYDRTRVDKMDQPLSGDRLTEERAYMKRFSEGLAGHPVQYPADYSTPLEDRPRKVPAVQVGCTRRNLGLADCYRLPCQSHRR